MFKNAKYKNLGENLYNKKKWDRLIDESAFVVLKLRHLTYQEYCIEFLLRLFIEKDFESSGRKTNRKHKDYDDVNLYLYNF